MTIGAFPDGAAQNKIEAAAMRQMESRNCHLRLAAEGTAEPCTGEQCPFWEPGGVVLESRCFIETLGVEVKKPDVAGYLLDVRMTNEAAQDRAAREAAHREFSRRIGLEL